MCRPSYGFPGRSRSRSGWSLLAVLLLGATSLSLMTRSDTAVRAPLHALRAEADYALELGPCVKRAELGERFEVELWVTEATPGLDMNKVEFLLEVTPGRVFIPDSMYSDPGTFIPDAFLVILEATHTVDCASARYKITGLTTQGSSTTQGWLATLAFDAVSAGTAELLLSSISAYNSSEVLLESPAEASGEIRIGPAMTGLPLEQWSEGGGAIRLPQVASSQAIPAQFVIDDWRSEDAEKETF